MAVVGSAQVKITADTSSILADIEKQLAGLDGLSKKMGTNVGKNLRQGIIDGMGNTDTMFAAPVGKSEAKGREAGAGFGKGFTAGATPYFKALSTALGRSFGADMASGANQSFASNLKMGQVVERQMEQAGRAAERSLERHVADGISDGAEKGSRQASRAMSNTMGGGAGRRDGNSYGSGFSGALDKWMGSRKSGPFEESIKGMAANIIPLQVMQGVLGGVAAAASSAVGAIISLGSALVYAAPAALKFANALGAVVQGAVVAKTLFSGVGDAVSAYSDSLDQTAQSSGTASKASKNLQKDMESEEERLLRIREARDALNDAVIEGARSNEDALEAVSDAQEALNDSLEDGLDAHEAYADSLEDLSDAQEAYNDALEDASDAQEAYTDSLEDTSDAQRDLADAMVDEKKALDDLNEARAEAQERLEDLALELERASLNEERAALNLVKAEQELANARAGGNANAIYEADLAYREQLQSVKELQESNGDLRDEANKAQEEGVDGNQAVIDAQRAQRDAVEATSDAQEALSDAIEASTDAQEALTDATEATADAQEGVADAIEGVSDAQEALRDATESTTDAQRELARAIEDVPRIAEDASIRIARAQLELKKALEGTTPAMADMSDAAIGTAGAIDKVKTAFDKLSPAAQDFVRFWVDRVIPIFEEIKKLGQEEFFPRFQEAIESIIENERMMQILQDTYVETSIILGDFTLKLAEAFTVPETMESFNAILESNEEILRDLLDAAVNLVAPLTTLFEATAPMAERFSESVKDATASFAEFIDKAASTPATMPVAGSQMPQAMSELDAFFAQAERLAGKFWTLIKNIGSSLGGLFSAALPAGEYFLDLMITKSESWGSSIKENEDGLTSLFFGAVSNASALLDVVGLIIVEFMKFGDNPYIREIADAFADLIPILGALMEDGFNQLAPAIIRVLDAIGPLLTIFAETGTIKAFADSIASVVEWVSEFVTWLMDFPNADKILGWAGELMGMYAAFKLISGLTGGALKRVTDFGKGTKKVVDGLIGAPKNIKSAWSSLSAGLDKAVDSVNRIMAGSQGKTKAGDAFDAMTPEEQAATGMSKKKFAKQGGRDAKAKEKADQAMKEATQALDDAARAEAEKIEQIGRTMGIDLSNGLEKGIEQSDNEVIAAARKMGVNVIEEIEHALGFRSPPFTYDMGIKVARALGQGIDKGENEAVREADQLGDAVEDELDDGMAQAGKNAGESAVDAEVRAFEQGENELNRAAREQANEVDRTGSREMRDAGENIGDAETDAIVREMEKGEREINAAVNEQVREAQRAADRAGPVSIDTDVDRDVGRGGKGKKGKVDATDLVDLDVDGKGKKKPGRFKKATSGAVKGIKGASKALAALPIPGARIVVGAATAGTALFALGENAKSGLSETEQAAMSTWDTIGLGWSTLWQGAQAKIGEFLDWLTNWWNNTFVPWWHSIWAGLGQAVSDLWAWIKEQPGNFWDWLKGWWNNTFVPWWHGIWEGLGTAVSDLWAWIKAQPGNFWDWLKGWWNNTFLPWWNGIWRGLGKAVSDLWAEIKAAPQNFLNWMKGWWNNTVVPWWNGIWAGLGGAVSKAWNNITQGFEDVYNKLLGIWNNKIWPWIKSIPDMVSDKLSSMWNGMASGFFDVIGSINRAWNSMIRALNALPFIDGLDEWTFNRPAGYAEGGVVQGPDRGPKADNVAAMLTPGEYVLTRDMVRQAGGVGPLEAWRRGKPPAARGGVGDFVWETTKSAVDWTKDLATKGAMTVVSGILKGVSAAFPNRKYLQKFIDWVINGGPMKTWTDKITGDAEESEKKRKEKEAAAATSGGGSVPPYDGDPGGWTYPMAKRYSGKDWSGHNPTGSFDIGVPIGVIVRAASVGKVVISKDLGSTSYGKYIKISHAGGQYTLYAHLSQRTGSGNVTTGQVIGKTGNTGGSSGPHLHFELSPLGSFGATQRNMAAKGVKLAAGGVVPATPGGLLALIGEGGRSERVTPLDNQGRSATEVEMLSILKQMAAKQGGDTFIVNPAPGMNERELAGRVSRQVALTHRRRS